MALILTSHREETLQVIPKTRWARTIDGAFIAYQDIGEGPVTLILIMGWISHLEVSWENPRFVRFIRRLSKNTRVLLFDKRGTGMSDRFTQPPDLEARMDDVRAVMDAAGVDRAALLGLGDGGPPLAAFFAATHPDRTVALCVDPHIHLRKMHDYPFGDTEEEFDQWMATETSTWGDEEAGSHDESVNDPEFVRWNAKMARFAATPGSMAALSRMWFETDVRDILVTIRVPTLVLAMAGSSWAGPEPAAYLADQIPGARIAEVPGRDPTVEDPEPFVLAIESFLASVRLEQADLDRVLATVLFTDIVEATNKMSASGDRGWRTLAERHHVLVRALLDRYRGTEMDTAGDGFFSTFDGPARAIRCALAIREAVRALDLEVRCGLHTGEVERIDSKAGGIAVSIGARICSLARGSEVLVSQTVKDLVAGSGLSFQDAGEHELKGVPDRWRLYRVLS
jgi:class 3 adenylate cyclase/pimeloyl-ACP methyl ester carboxylesterase